MKKRLDVVGMQSRRTRARIDLRLDGENAEFRQGDPFPAAKNERAQNLFHRLSRTATEPMLAQA